MTHYIATHHVATHHVATREKILCIGVKKLPFEYGDLVSKSQFINRTAELKRLATNLARVLNTKLISSRRWRKSCREKQIFSIKINFGLLAIL